MIYAYFGSVKSAVWLGAAEFLRKELIYKISMVLAPSEWKKSKTWLPLGMGDEKVYGNMRNRCCIWKGLDWTRPYGEGQEKSKKGKAEKWNKESTWEFRDQEGLSNLNGWVI